jgi:ribosomal protein S12 methylthiotransferase accessory factor
VRGGNPRLTPFAYEIALEILAHDLEREPEKPQKPGTIAPAVFNLNLRTLQISRFRLVADSHCPVCSPARDDSSAAAMVQLRTRVKPSAGTFRLAPVRDYPFPIDGYVNPIAGMLGKRARPGYNSPTNAPVSGSFAIKSKYRYHESWWCGQGTTFADSLRLGFIEGLERHAGLMARGKKTTVFDCYENLREDAMDPAQCGMYQPEFYRTHYPIYLPFTPERKYFWVWGYSFNRRRPILVPEQLVYYLDHRKDHPNFVQDCSNGCATGSCLEEAILFGLLELIERDSFLISWYAKLGLPRIDPWSSTNREILFLVDRIRKLGYDLHLFDMRLDLKVPSVMGLGVRLDPGLGKLVVAAAAGLDPEQAVLGAIREVGNSIPGFIQRVEKQLDRVRLMRKDYTKVKGILDHALLYGLPEMEEDVAFWFDGSEVSPIEELYASWHQEYSPSLNLLEDLLFCIRHVQSLGLDVVVVDQTSPEQEQVGLKTACVICPGLMPMDFGYDRQRVFDLPRLFTVPRATGHRSQQLQRSELNATPHPFP